MKPFKDSYTHQLITQSHNDLEQTFAQTMHFAIDSFCFCITGAHNQSLQFCCSCTYYSILYVSHTSRWSNMPELEVSAAAITWTISFRIEWLFWLIEIH